MNKTKGLLVLLLATLSFITVMLCLNVSSQVDPGFRFKKSTDNNWMITHSDYPQLDVGTEIEYLRIDGLDYAIQESWLKQSVVTIKTDAELSEFLNNEQFLQGAIRQSVSLVDTDKQTYDISFKKRSLLDTSLYFWLHPLLAITCSFFALWALFVGRLNHFHIVHIVAAVSYSISIMMSISGMERLWAVSPDALYYRFALGNLCMRIFVCAYLYLLWNIPYRLGKGNAFAYIPHALLAIFVATWFSQFSGIYQNFDLLVIKVIFIGGLLALLAMILQWRLADKTKQLVNQIALRWMLTTIGACVLFGFGFNLLWQAGYADGQEADLINLAVVLLYQMGITALLLKHLLYKLETWWWRAWGIFGGLTLGLCALILSAELSFGYSPAALVVAVATFIFGYFIISAYFRYRYAKYDAKLMERSVPELVKVSTSFNKPEVANLLWLNLLKRTFTPKSSELISNKKAAEIHWLDTNEPQLLTPSNEKATLAKIYEEGEKMLVNGLSDQQIVLSGAASGMRLFTQRDIDKVALFWQVASQSRLVQQAYIDGESAERKRIAADLHDDIGGKLLYLSSVDGKFGSYARETLDDLRTLTRGLSSGEKLLSELIADINYSLAERCEVADIDYFAKIDIEHIASHVVSARSATMLTSVLSELHRNALQHTGVKKIELIMTTSSETLCIQFKNDGAMTNPDTWRTGLGTVSMKRRINEVKGHISWVSQEQGGVVCQLSWPITTWLSLH